MHRHAMPKHFKKAIYLENVVLLKLGYIEGFGVVEDEDGSQLQMRKTMNK